MPFLQDRLKKVIESSGLTREEFADKCDVSKAQLYRYLKGEQKPGAPFLQKLIEEFPNVDMGWLLAGIERETETEAWLCLDSAVYPDRDLWNYLFDKGLGFEARIAEMMVFEAMKEVEYILEDEERKKLAEYVAKNKVLQVFEFVKEHLSIMKEMPSKKE